MTLPRLGALQRHWSKHPRIEWLVAGFLGYKPPQPKKQADLGELLAMFGMRPGQVGKRAI